MELPDNAKWDFRRQQIGYKGHVDFIGLIKPLLPEDFVLLNDISLKLPYKFTQIDSLLITDSKIIRFEVKNILSQYEYKDGVWYSNGYRMSNNYFTQVKRAGEILEELMRENKYFVPIESQLVFINEDDNVSILGDDHQGEYLMRGQIRPFLKNEIENRQFGQLNPMEMAHFLKKQSIELHSVLDLKHKDLREQVQRGVQCCQCGGGNLDSRSKRYHIVCNNCGFAEPKQKAVLRTICDIGVLYYDQPLTKRQIMEFIGDFRLNHTIKRVLKRYFKPVENGKNYLYANPVKRMEIGFNGIKFRY